MWRSKLSWVLSKTARTNEIAHITGLLKSMNDSWFDEERLADESFAEEVDNYLVRWVTVSIYYIGWSEQYAFSIIALLSNENIQNGNTKSDFKETPLGGNCTCSSTSDWCDAFGGDLGGCSTSWDCEETSLGCGTLWTYSCDGVCELGNPGGGGPGK